MGVILVSVGMLQGGAAAYPLDMSTTISITLLVVVIGAVWRLSSVLTSIGDKLERLEKTPGHLRHIDLHLISVEEDLNNLWAATRSGDPSKVMDTTRRPRYQPFPVD